MAELKRAVKRSRAARFNEIVNILIGNDFGGLLRAMLSGHTSIGSHRPEERMRIILEELGPTFIKLGQLLATRPDLIPRSYSEEFKKLYDGTDPSGAAEVRQVIHDELGQDVEDVFATFDADNVIGSASIGQVHRATLKDGTEVAVKVQHVGIEDAMILDFEILRGIVTFIEKTFAASRVWQPVQHLEELQSMLERELDYTFEVKNTLRVRDQFRHDDSVIIPNMYKSLCSRRVMTMEFIAGHKFGDPAELDKVGIDRKNVAKLVTNAMARQIFVNRVFHADPSPGNLMVMDSDTVVFLDFGAIGVVTNRRAKAIFKLITGISKGDVEGTSEAIIDLCDQHGEYDPKRFQSDVERILDFFEREEVSVADPRIMEMIMELARSHKMLLPPDFMLITRALFQFDGFCRDLDPDYELVAVLEPLVAELVWKNLTSTKKQKEVVEDTVGELLKFARSFPHTLNHVVRRIERNELRTTIDIAGMEGLKRAQGRAALKMAFSIMMAALVIGFAIVAASPGADTRVGQYLFGAGAVTVVWALTLVIWSESYKGRNE